MRAVAAHYDRQATQLVRLYGELTFEEMHRALLHFLPEPGARILDVGAGSGRDAQALVALGYEVVAVEPSLAMRRASGSTRDATGVVWIDDRLPCLRRVRSSQPAFDFVFCSAVLMHLSDRELPEAFKALRAVSVTGAKIAATLRPPQDADPADVFHNHPRDRFLHAAQSAGLALRASGDDRDRLGRSFAWSWFVFEAVEPGWDAFSEPMP
jgi:SAM-dependent methyltransferase